MNHTIDIDLDFPLMDFHVHLDGITIEKVLELSRERGVMRGIVEHAGTTGNEYPVILSNHKQLKRYLGIITGKETIRETDKPLYVQPGDRGCIHFWKEWSSK